MGSLHNSVSDTALVFEGGGMRGSHTAGVVRVLLDAGIHLPFVAGISAGSSHTCNYLSRDAWRAHHSFTEFAADPKFGDWRTFVRGQGMFNSRYIYEETSEPGQALPLDWGTFCANPAEMRIGAFHAESGEMVYWSRKDTPELRDLVVRVRASSTMPIIMPPTVVDGETYVDGALGPSGGIALDAAEEAGYERFFVVLTRERDYVKSPERAPGLYRRYFRRYPAVAEAIINRWQRYNETRERLFELEKAGRAVLFVPEDMPVGNGERNVAKLEAAYQLGLAQAQRELPAWQEFLGV